ncbi:E3 ubiquitin-protein ligase TRIM35-like [Protopterus annectens]|uniref:E3 ubiquitin-protein ligase TRIM35-like n=1 Tax=Protopterus annectens TaxID=7888 RepID=UPI001CFBD6A7|nr:E3 ubiquitin-protein ligase TRIM35-like [Protopterus annectens]
MAAEYSVSELGEELLCSICLDLFKDAVTLRCGHNFCRACVVAFWQRTNSQACPVCRGISTATDLITNRTLSNVVEKFVKEQMKYGESSEEICSLHGEKLKMYCMDEKILICVVCQTSQKHESHKIRPLQEAAEQLRSELPLMENCLQDKLKKYKKSMLKYSVLFDHLKEQGQKTERQIMSEFSKLRQFLQDEENRIIAELKKEEEEKRSLLEKNMLKIKQCIADIMVAITKLKEESHLEDIDFLMNHSSRKRSAAFVDDSPPKIPPGALIDVPKYVGGVLYKTWKKMQSSVEAMPFYLDPNTSGPWLTVSEDLSSMQCIEYKPLPQNPERFKQYSCILGSEGFSSGIHTWEVEVGNCLSWGIGVAEESINRKKQQGHDIRTGFYSIVLKDSHEYKARDSPGTVLSLQHEPKRIRVHLNYSGGELSFHDIDTQTLIYSFNVIFTGKVFPYFYVGPPTDDKVYKPFRICSMPETL